MCFCCVDERRNGESWLGNWCHVHVRQDASFSPAISNCCHVDLIPCIVGEPHSIELVDNIDFSRGYATIVAINCIVNKLGTVMCLEATDDALVIRLYVCGKIWLEVLNMDVGK